MKILITLFVLFFSSSVFADDISDFEIEGMSIGNSLLDYFSEEEIKSWRTDFHEKSKKFYITYSPSKSSDKYQQYGFYLKKNDKKFIIYAISGAKFFGKDNIQSCKNFKESVVKDIISTLNNISPDTYEHKYDYLEDGKSIAYVTDFNFKKGSIRVWCVDWSNITEKNMNWEDNVSVTISSKEQLDWLNNEAN